MGTTDRAAADAASEAEYEALKTSSGVHILRRDVLSVSGPDTATYLQGQCSQDVEVLGVGDTAESLLLSPQGKIEAYLRISRVGDEAFVIDTDQGFGAVVTARLERFRLRMRVTIEPLDWTCAAWRGPDAPRDSTGISGTAAARVVAPVEWPGFVGVDLLGPNPPGGLTDWVGDPPVRVGDEAWDASRIEAGVPVNGREIVEGSIAAEVGLVERTVSFTKGCFTGQELVARLDSRGSKVARHLCGVVIEDADDLGPSLVGASVLTADGDHEVGRLSSVARSPRSGLWVALATLHRRVEPPAPVLITWTGADGPRRMAAESRPLPLVGWDR